MSQNVTLFQIFGTKLRLPFMFGSGSERLLELVSPLNRAKSGKSDIFKPSRSEPLYQPYFGFWLFAGSRCGWIEKKVAKKIPGTKITRYYLRRHLHRVIGSRRHLCPKSPETFESKLSIYWLKEP